MSPSRKTSTQIALLILLMTGAETAFGDAASSAPVAAQAAATPAENNAAPARGVQAAEARLYDLLGQLNYTSSRGAVPVLVIPAKEMDAQAFTRIVEDLSIMGRIIEKNLQGAQQEHFAYAMATELGRNVFLPSGGSGPRILRSSSGRPKPMYIGGYGALFSLRVGFPLVPPPQVPEPNKAAEQTDRVWAQAQQELLDPRGAARMQQGVPQESIYNAEAVADLRTTLMALLKHATNVRDLEPDAWLTILVQGPAPTAPSQPQDPLYAEQPTVYGELFYQANLSGAGDEGGTVMTLRTKKADIDQYAKGQLDEAQFQQRVQIVTH